MEWILYLFIGAALVKVFGGNFISKEDKDEKKAQEREELKQYTKQFIKDDEEITAKITIDTKTTYEYTEDKDNFEGWFYDEVNDYVPVYKSLKIKYKDGKNQVTKRVIQVYKFGEASFGGFILAFCELREANRTFRTDRIIECMDNDTGEFIDDVSKYLMDNYYNSDDYRQLQDKLKKQQEKEIQDEYYNTFISKYEIVLKVLLYIVRCDGTFNHREKAIVKELFENLEKNNELLTDKLLEKIYKNFQTPSLQSFKIAVGKLISNNEYKIDLLTITKNIISTQKTIHHNEKEVLEYLEKKLNVTNLEDEIKYKPQHNQGIICPHCNSQHIHKKDKRVLKNHTNQRYQCQDCKKIFSIKIS